MSIQDLAYNKENKHMSNYSYVLEGIMEDINIEGCQTTIIHKDTIKKVQEKLPKDDILYDLADLFKIFSDRTRIKILCALLLLAKLER